MADIEDMYGAPEDDMYAASEGELLSKPASDVSVTQTNLYTIIDLAGTKVRVINPAYVGHLEKELTRAKTQLTQAIRNIKSMQSEIFSIRRDLGRLSTEVDKKVTYE